MTSILLISLLGTNAFAVSEQVKECYGYCLLSHPDLKLGDKTVGSLAPSKRTLFGTGKSLEEIRVKLKSECENTSKTEYNIASHWIGGPGGLGSLNCNYDDSFETYWDQYDDLKKFELSNNQEQESAPKEKILIPQFAVIPALNQAPLIVVHASEAFDESKSAKKGIDQKIQTFKIANSPVIYLVDALNNEGLKEWYTEDRNPLYIAQSNGGENNLVINTSEVTMIGGFFGNAPGFSGCLTRAIHDVIAHSFEANKNKKSLSIHLPTKAMYYYSDDGIEKDLNSAPFNANHFIDHTISSIFSADEEGNTSTTFGDSSNYLLRGLKVNLSNFQFNYYFQSKLIKKTGNGPRVIHLLFE